MRFEMCRTLVKEPAERIYEQVGQHGLVIVSSETIEPRPPNSRMSGRYACRWERWMMTRRTLGLGGLGAAAAGLGLSRLMGGGSEAKEARTFPVSRSDEEWKKTLTPEQYRVLRGHGTERAGTSPLDREKRRGTFVCAACAQPLFTSDTKFDSGTGWPSFFRPIEGAVGESQDNTLWMTRTEVHCGNCGGHLGHVFPDGPPPTGLRYCMNGVSMKFSPAEAA
jgi:peptide-methionine (R)-S-oxide reductase